jgi:hypothetical protein
MPFRFLTVAGLVLPLSGCTADRSSTSQAGGPCQADVAQGLIGKAKPTDAEVMQLTDATRVRQITPGDMVTQDFREDRVTVETDPGTGLVAAARCG